ncbi:hypothetical protein ACFXPS_43710 [Nocardia sp. NPDC059091]|uniref:hypothetical protein n=1 Tax=Nocardia sp. NPDC059091 TaxID=3346724 RepID=UPI0036A5E864
MAARSAPRRCPVVAGLAAAAILLDDFHEQAAAQVCADRLIVGLVNPDHLFVAAADSGQVDGIRQAVLTSPPNAQHASATTHARARRAV